MPITEDQKNPLLKLHKKNVSLRVLIQDVRPQMNLERVLLVLDYYLEEKNDLKFKIYVRVKKMTKETLSCIKLKSLIKLKKKKLRAQREGEEPGWGWGVDSLKALQKVILKVGYSEPS